VLRNGEDGDGGKPKTEVTQLLVAWSSGDAVPLEQLAPLVEHELRRLAPLYLRREGGGRQTPANCDRHQCADQPPSRAAFDSRASRPQAVDEGQAARFRRHFDVGAVLSLTQLGRVAERRPKDNQILEVPINRNADLIVTRDADILALGTFQNVPIVTPATYVPATASTG